jgi:hypothetical protein
LSAGSAGKCHRAGTRGPRPGIGDEGQRYLVGRR